jgi:hypothetical protein
MNARGHGYQFGRPHGNGWGQAPNDTRVRGAGPPRKTFVRPKACKAPHPLQPIVRPPCRERGTPGSARLWVLTTRVKHRSQSEPSLEEQFRRRFRRFVRRDDLLMPRPSVQH